MVEREIPHEAVLYQEALKVILDAFKLSGAAILNARRDKVYLDPNQTLANMIIRLNGVGALKILIECPFVDEDLFQAYKNSKYEHTGPIPWPPKGILVAVQYIIRTRDREGDVAS